MNKVKYAVTAVSLALLTLAFMVLPDAYNNYTESKNSKATVTDVSLEHGQKSLTAAETVKILQNTLDNCIIQTITPQRDTAEYVIDCTELIKDVFGSEKESDAAAFILELISSSGLASENRQSITAPYGDGIVTLNINTMVFDNLIITYDLQYKTLISIDIAETDISSVSFDDEGMLYKVADEFQNAITKYYKALGLVDGEYYCSAEFGEFHLYSGIYRNGESEEGIQF